MLFFHKSDNDEFHNLEDRCERIIEKYFPLVEVFDQDKDVLSILSSSNLNFVEILLTPKECLKISEDEFEPNHQAFSIGELSISNNFPILNSQENQILQDIETKETNDKCLIFTMNLNILERLLKRNKLLSLLRPESDKLLKTLSEFNRLLNRENILIKKFSPKINIVEYKGNIKSYYSLSFIIEALGKNNHIHIDFEKENIYQDDYFFSIISEKIDSKFNVKIDEKDFRNNTSEALKNLSMIIY